MTTAASNYSGTDFLFYDLGINFIGVDTVNENYAVNWKEYQNTELTEETYLENKKNGVYNKGVAIICGKVWRGPNKDLWHNIIDIDNKIGFEEFFKDYKKIELDNLIEDHEDNPYSAHFHIVTERPIKFQRLPNIDREIQPAIEVKSEGKAMCNTYPSNHGEKVNGNLVITPWKFNELKLPTFGYADQIENRLNEIYSKYNIPYLGSKDYKKLVEEKNNIPEGSRHNTLVKEFNSLWHNHIVDYIDDKITEDEVWTEAQEIAAGCKPEHDPLDTERIFVDAANYVKAQYELDPERYRKKKKTMNYSAFGKDCIYYQTNTSPDRWIGGTEDNRLVEMELKYGRDGTPKYVMTRSFTTCKPVKIAKHKNLLSFLDLPQRYTMQFRGQEASGNFTIKHKTLSEISGQLRDGNALTESGIDIALQTQVKAFEKTGLIEENDDMHFIGFFTNENRTVIIPSEIEFKEIDNVKLAEALNYINELAELGYSNRLDLLAHTIKFGIIAPCSFIFKYIKSAWLEWMDLYGKPNASKSTSGKIILAIDGHDKEEEYSVNMGHVDTIARLGETIGATTFPKLVDEMDFNDDKKLVSNVKMAISNTILRIVLDRYRRKETILSLSALVMTSNSEPPKEPGFRKRLAIRYFADNEIHFKDAEDSKKFDALLTNLNKLQALGDFRNKFIMENQDMILNKYMTPFEKAQKIMIAAYEQTGVILPDWLLNGELVQNPLEETIGDNAVYIRHAFETYILENFRKALTIWQKTEKEDLALLPTEIDKRLIKLIDSHELTDIKRRPSKDIVIYRSLINELYKYGVSSEQLPNLRALADSIGAKYRPYHGYNVAIIEGNKLSEYFDGINNEDLGD